MVIVVISNPTRFMVRRFGDTIRPRCAKGMTMRQDRDTSPRYEQILFDDLQLKESFLQKHEAVISDRLHRAAEGFQSPSGEFSAVNECLHVASSVVLRGATNVRATLEDIGRDPIFRGKDPATVLTVAALYYLLRTTATYFTKPQEKESFDQIRQRFVDMNWMIGPTAMKGLGFQR